MDPIQIVVTAETQEAVKNLQQVPQAVQQVVTGLKQTSTAAAPAVQAVKELASQSGNSRLAMMELGHVVRATAEGMAAGISPTRILAMELPRIAQAASISGISLASMLPAIGAVAAAVAAGVLIWHTYGSATREAEKSASNLHEQLEGVAKIFAQLRDMQKAGLLSPEAVKRNLDLMSGKTPLYKRPDGTFTTDKQTHDIETGSQAVDAETVVPSLLSKTTTTVENQKASLLEVQKYILDNINVQGKQDEIEVEASAKIRRLREEIHAQSLSEAEQEKEKIHLKYQAEWDEIDATAVNMGSLLTAKQEADNAAAKATSLQNEAMAKSDVDFKIRQRDQLAASAAFAEGQKLFAQTVADENTKLDADLALSAAKQGKTREQIYQEEFDKRMSLIMGQLFAGEINEKQYTDAVKAASVIREEGAKKETDAQHRLLMEISQVRRLQMQKEVGDVLSNPFTTNANKAAALTPYIKDTQAQILQADADAKSAKNAQERNDFEKERVRLAQEYTQLQIQQIQLAPTMFQAMKAGVTQLQNTYNVLSQDMANLATSPVRGLHDGLQNAIDDFLKKGGSLKEFFSGIGLSILSSMRQAFSQMVADWIMSHIVMKAVSAAWHAFLSALNIETTSETAVHTAAQVGIHTAGEATKTGVTAAGASTRSGIRLAETIFHGLQVLLRVSAHIAGEVGMTAVTIVQSAIRIGLILAESVVFIIMAAVEAMAAVAAIPVVGPILAIAALGAVLAAGFGALGKFDQGGYTGAGGKHEPAGVVHRGEFVMNAERTAQFRPELEAMHAGRMPAFVQDTGNIMPGLAASRNVHSQATPSRRQSEGRAVNVMVHFQDDPQRTEKDVRNNPNIHHVIVDVAKRNAHHIRPAA